MEKETSSMLTRLSLDNFCDMKYWFNILKTIQGINIPRTEIINYTGDDLMNLCDGIMPNNLNKLADDIREASTRIGVPFFLRTGLTSAKHNWENTCYVPDNSVKTIKRHIYNIVEFSVLADIMGLSTYTWIVREFLPIRSDIIAKNYGDMPISKERRYFIKNGKVVHIQAYWPEHAVKQGHPNIKKWKDVLAEINYQSEQEVKELTVLSELVGSKFKEYWSVDWLYVDNKWYLTDMARGEVSYRY